MSKKKKLTIADIKRNNNTTVPSVISKIKARELELTILCVILIISVIITSSYIVFSSVRREKKYNVLKTGSMEVVFKETDYGMGYVINIVNEHSIIDKESKKLVPYTFTIKNISKKSRKYTVKIEKDLEMIEADKCEDKQYNISDLRYSIDNKHINNLEDDKVIYSEKVGPSEEKIHKLRIWVSSDVKDDKDVINKHFHGQIVITSEDDKNLEIMP